MLINLSLCHLMHHTPHSPDTSPCDYDFLTKIKEHLRHTRVDIRRASDRSQREIFRNDAADGVCRLPRIW